MSKGKILDINGSKGNGGQQQPPQPKQLTQQDVMDAPDVGCVRCDGELFLPATRFKRISKLLTGESEDKLVNLQTMVCAACGWEFGKEVPESVNTTEPKTTFDS